MLRTADTLRRAFNHLLASGVTNLYYGRGEGKFGGRDMATDFEAQASTVNACHPPPLALRSMASYVASLVEAIYNGTARALPVPTAQVIPQYTCNTNTNINANELIWVDASAEPEQIAVEGKGFSYAPQSDASFWQRFPSAANESVPSNIFRLSRSPSGVLVRFRTNASSVFVNVTRDSTYSTSTFSTPTPLDQDDISTFNGREGLDAHIQDASAVNYGKWRWIATEAATSHKEFGQMKIDLPSSGPASPADGWHNITVFLPIWVPVLSLYVGVIPSASLVALRPYKPKAKPLYVWGSSIAQGAVVTNAGMTWPMNLQRIVDVPLLNYGFSGSCGMQLNVAEQISKASPPPLAFVMDCQPNMQSKTPDQMVNSTKAVLAQLRASLGHDCPILVLEGHLYTNNWIKLGQQAQQLALNAAQRSAVEAAQKAGDTKLFYLGAEGKLGDDAGVAMDSTGGIGVHPSSLAHLHMAEYIAKGLAPILRQQRKEEERLRV